MRKDQKAFLALNAYLGCEVPKPFFLRFQAMCEIRGGDKRVVLAGSVEDETIRWEKKVDARTAQAYDALLEIKARQNNFSVNDLKAPLEVKRLPKGKRTIVSPKISNLKMKKV